MQPLGNQAVYDNEIRENAESVEISRRRDSYILLGGGIYYVKSQRTYVRTIQEREWHATVCRTCLL